MSFTPGCTRTSLLHWRFRRQDTRRFSFTVSTSSPNRPTSSVDTTWEFRSSDPSRERCCVAVFPPSVHLSWFPIRQSSVTHAGRDSQTSVTSPGLTPDPVNLLHGTSERRIFLRSSVPEASRKELANSKRTSQPSWKRRMISTFSLWGRRSTGKELK